MDINRIKVIRELSGMILTRGPKLCNVVEWRGFKVVYKRYVLTIYSFNLLCLEMGISSHLLINGSGSGCLYSQTGQVKKCRWKGNHTTYLNYYCNNIFFFVNIKLFYKKVFASQHNLIQPKSTWPCCLTSYLPTFQICGSVLLYVHQPRRQRIGDPWNYSIFRRDS